MARTESSPIAPPQRRVTFPDLVRVHVRWRQSVDEGSPMTDAQRARLDAEYHEALALFEAEPTAGERAPADVPLWLPNRSLSRGNGGPRLDP